MSSEALLQALPLHHYCNLLLLQAHPDHCTLLRHLRHLHQRRQLLRLRPRHLLVALLFWLEKAVVLGMWVVVD